MKGKILSAMTILSLLSCKPRTFNSSVETATGNRPPQFIVMSFDGAGEVKLWKRWRNLDKKTGGKIKTTGFLSGVYMLTNNNRTLYHPPAGMPPGKSDIGFIYTNANDHVQSDEEYIDQLVDQLNAAYQEHHEIGTHLNGHFCSGASNKWSASDWNQELSEFYKLFFNVSTNNAKWSRNGQSQPISSPGFSKQEVMGVRTPCLEGNPATYYPVIAKNGFKYDASRIGETTLWPHTNNGLWEMKLARLTLYGTNAPTVSMDYNFMVNQEEVYNDDHGTHISVAGDLPADMPNRNAIAEGFSSQMYKTYVKYFDSVYYGNRAPMHIGHHHSLWNHGAYEQALYTFASKVCTMPEVRCVSYRDLVAFLEENKAKIATWENGGFEKLPRDPNLFNTLTDWYKNNKSNAYNSPEYTGGGTNLTDSIEATETRIREHRE